MKGVRRNQNDHTAGVYNDGCPYRNGGERTTILAGELLGRGERTRSSPGRSVFLRGADHRGVLPPIVPVATAQARERRLFPDSQWSRARGLSSLQALQAGAGSTDRRQFGNRREDLP